MDKRHITFFVLTNDSSRSRQVKMPVRRFKMAAVGAGILALVLAFIVIDYARLRIELPGKQALMRENAGQKVELMNLAGKVRDLETNLAKLNLFDKKLRVIANIDTPPAGKKLRGMGGSAAGDDFFPTTGPQTAELVERMKGELAALNDLARSQETSFTELQEQLMKRTSYLASTPSIWPTRGWVTSTFGRRVDPFTGLPHSHHGIDIANRVGTPVAVTADGVVTKTSWTRALGKYVQVRHGYGYKTVYGHLAETFVKVGQRVKRGDRIATMGNTGRSTGPHLHYAVLVNGSAVNPFNYILN